MVSDQLLHDVERYLKEHLEEERISNEKLYFMTAMIAPSDLEQDDSFVEKLFGFIDERGLSDVETYKKALIDRRLFSKIRSDFNYAPSKQTAIQFAIALELSIKECEDLLNSAGFTLSYSSRFDLIIRYFIEHHIYSFIDINETLAFYNEKLIGIS